MDSKEQQEIRERMDLINWFLQTPSASSQPQILRLIKGELSRIPDGSFIDHEPNHRSPA